MPPRPSEDHTPSRPLAGTELFMESHSSPLLVVPQPKLIEHITKYIQNKFYTDKLDQDRTSNVKIVESYEIL